MSAQSVEHVGDHQSIEDGDRSGQGPDLTSSPEPLEVRRNAALAAVVGAAASAIAIAYLWRAAGTSSALDWTLCAVMGLIAATFLRSLLDSRTPLLVADEMGVRIRFGTEWRGIPWEAVNQVVVQRPRGILHDGRLALGLHHVQRAIEGLDGRALRHARLNQRLYGAALAVPLGATTKVTGEGAELSERLSALSQGRAEVVSLIDTAAPESESVDLGSIAVPAEPIEAGPIDADPKDADPAESTPIDQQVDAPRRRRMTWLRRRTDDRPHPGALVVDDEVMADAPGVDDREVVDPAMHEDAIEDLAPPDPVESVSVLEPELEPALEPAPTPVRLVESTHSDRVRPIAKLGEPVEPLVIGDFEPEPAYDPVIGPELAAARTRVGLSVDELADRTRIRPHVIESIEVDDFAPCGGDFYARGHIRTLARMLGKDPGPMVAAFDARYATAPVNPRRVFEAKLATGLTGSMRSAAGGPNWALLIGVVLMLVLVWSALRLFAGDSQEVLRDPPPVLNGSSGLGNVYGKPTPAPRTVPATVTAVNAPAHVVVRDASGGRVLVADLVTGEVRRLEVDPPVTISTDNGGAVSVSLGRRDLGFLGDADQPATRVLTPRKR